MITIAHVVHFLQRFAPLELAEDWDNVGLLLGDDAGEVQRVMTCLTITPTTADEAIKAGAQLIVSHHPIFFRPVKKLTSATSDERMALGLARAGVAVYSPHTAFDNTTGGINDILANKLNLHNVQPLRHGAGPAQCKVAVFVPDADLNRVADAMFGAGAGNIGQYSECSFRLKGTGTFFGSDAASPTVGQKGRREEVSEWRLEALCSERDVERVVAAMRQAHSYEEPAYDVYSLRTLRGQGGAGRVGDLPSTKTLGELANKLKETLPASVVQRVGEAERRVERVAIACGAAGEFLHDAVRERADVFLTGEVRFHDCLTAQSKGLALLLPGHHATERPGVEALADMLGTHFSSLDVWASRSERDPLEV